MKRRVLLTATCADGLDPTVTAPRAANGQPRNTLLLTCILFEHKTFIMSYTLPAHLHDDPYITQGRIVALEFERYFLTGLYVMPAGSA